MAEHLQPQIKQNSLVAKTKANYSIAQSYYSQRRKSFYSFLANNGIKATNIDEQITNAIETIWNKEIFNVISGIYWSGKKNNVSVAQMTTQVNQQIVSKFNLSPEITKHLMHAIKQGNPRNFYSSLGFAFENWLAEEGVGKVLGNAANWAQGHANNLINSFITEGLQSKASAVSGIKNIRSDILLTTEIKESFEKNNDGVLMSPTGLPMEFQSMLEVDLEAAIPTTEEIMNDRELLKEFLDPDKGNVFGFSAKSWKASNGKEFMKSSVLQKMLNTTFDQTDSKGQRHSWQPDYTMEYVTYFLSHRILDIVGPTTVAMTTRQGFMWMDEFLSQHIFYMRVQLEKFWKKKDGGLGRIYPKITDPGVYVRNYNLANAGAFTAKMHNTKKQGRYIDLKIK